MNALYSRLLFVEEKPSLEHRYQYGRLEVRTYQGDIDSANCLGLRSNPDPCMHECYGKLEYHVS